MYSEVSIYIFKYMTGHHQPHIKLWAWMLAKDICMLYHGYMYMFERCMPNLTVCLVAHIMQIPYVTCIYCMIGTWHLPVDSMLPRSMYWSDRYIHDIYTVDTINQMYVLYNGVRDSIAKHPWLHVLYWWVTWQLPVEILCILWWSDACHDLYTVAKRCMSYIWWRDGCQ